VNIPARQGHGQALVEFALVLPIFMVLLFALLDFGRVVYAQNTVAEAAREAARFASVSPSDSKADAIRNTAIRMAPGLGLTGANVSGAGCADCFYPDGTDQGDRAVVKVSVRIDLITPLISQLMGGSFEVESTSRAYIP
jgi:Flp pilus assembly protein TadG